MKTRLSILISSKTTSIIWVFLICLPLINQVIPFFKDSALAGVFTVEKPSENSWWTGGAQKNIEAKLNQKLTIKSFCYKLRNQIEFSFTNKINAQDMYYYKGVFYRMNSPIYNINAGYVGREKIEKDLLLLQKYRKQKHSKPMVFLIPPFKLSYFNAQLPKINRKLTGPSNYKNYTTALTHYQFDLVDVNKWFSDYNVKTKKPALIGTAGVHWTLYAATLAMDSLVKLSEKKLNRSFPNPIYQLDYTSVYDEDEDGYQLANLLFSHQDPNLVQVHFPKISSKQKIKALIVSDSYFNAIYWTKLYDQIFDSNSVFYYYLNTRKQRGKPDQAFNQKRFEQDLNSVDLVLVISEVNNLERFAFDLPRKLP